MKKRVAAGIRRRRELGELGPENVKPLQARPGVVVDGRFQPGPALTKQQRRVLIQACELAIYSLANNERADYCHAVVAINAVRRQARMRVRFMKEILEGVALQAAELAGEEFKMLDQVARMWLAQDLLPSGKIYSIAKGNGDGN